MAEPESCSGFCSDNPTIGNALLILDNVEDLGDPILSYLFRFIGTTAGDHKGNPDFDELRGSLSDSRESQIQADWAIKAVVGKGRACLLDPRDITDYYKIILS